jgi:2-C-methyl-D-erythritol 4-phosphate cytidylyltransferase
MAVKTIAIIPAAGMGIRMGLGIPKQFLLIRNTPILALTLMVFQQSDDVDHIIVVVPKDEIRRCEEEIVKKYGLNKTYKVIAGGKRRQDSVRLGLYVAQQIANDNDLILIHDGVRPFVKKELIANLVKEAKKNNAVVAGIPAKDTVKEVDKDGYVLNTLTRDKIWLIQTPQVFRFKDILYAHKRAHSEAWEGITDDAILLERLGISVKVIMGSEDNIKITTPSDLKLAEFILQKQ